MEIEIVIFVEKGSSKFITIDSRKYNFEAEVLHFGVSLISSSVKYI